VASATTRGTSTARTAGRASARSRR
jgi:hypothetical protein